LNAQLVRYPVKRAPAPAEYVASVAANIEPKRGERIFAQLSSAIRHALLQVEIRVEAF